MPEIAEKEVLTPQIVRLKVIAPDIAKKRRPGQFVILRVDERGERIPLTMFHSDFRDGTVTIVFQIVGKTTHMLSQLERRDKNKQRPSPRCDYS